MADLLPCPFCGAKPNSPRESGGGDERNGYNFTMTIACGCGATMSARSKEGPGGWCIDRGEALASVVAAWNRRTPPAGDAPATKEQTP